MSVVYVGNDLSLRYNRINETPSALTRIPYLQLCPLLFPCTRTLPPLELSSFI